jgi:hypothetical protein
MEVSHGVLKKGLKNDLNPPFLYRLGGLKNSTTIKQEPKILSISFFSQLISDPRTASMGEVP